MIIFLFCVLPFTASEKVEIINEQGRQVINLLGDVTFTKPNFNITCDNATVFGEEKAILRGNVVLVESTSTIKAESLRFKIKTGEGTFYNSVLSESSLVISSCSLKHNSNNRKVFGFDSVVINDSINDFTLEADYFIYHQNTGIGESDGNPKLIINRADEDPIVAHSQLIRYYRNDDKLSLYDSVTINDKKMTITCDSLNFYNHTSTGDLYNLNIESQNDEIDGIYAEFYIKDREIESMDVVKATVTHHDEDRQHLLISDSLNIDFQNGIIREVEAKGKPKGKITWR